MTSIWHESPAGWSVLEPQGFAAEALLHDLVEGAPRLLPLAGSPSLVILGREVHLGSGYADLLAIDPTGDLAIIELKLASNSEAKRAVVAQVLSYAAFLDHMSYDDLEGRVLADHLRRRGFPSLAAAGRTAAQGQFDEIRFREALSKNLAEGRFRLVLVLDAVPPELPRLVSYLEGIAPNLLIDLVAVGSYSVAGELIVVPHRVEPERRPAEIAATSAAGNATIDEAGADSFERAVQASESPATKEEGARLIKWARDLENRNLARLVSVQGSAMRTLRIYIPGDMSLACVFLDGSGLHLALYGSVFAKRAPQTLNDLNEVLGPARVGQGTNVDLAGGVLALVAQGYEEAARRGLVTDGPIRRDGDV